MMQAMRERVKVIYWVVILTFIGLMFLGWGIGDWNAPTMQPGSEPVATIDGQPIGRMEWEQRARSILTSTRARNDGSVTESDLLMARDQAFESLIEEHLQLEAAERMGISVDDAEIEDILRNDPPPFLLAQFTDPEGNPDVDAYYRALDDPAADWSRVREMLRETLPLQKLNQRLAAAAVVGDVELRQIFAEQNTEMVAEWVGIRFADIELDDETVTDDQARAYYEQHLDDYKQAPRATVRLVKIDKVAGEEDEQDVLSILQEIRSDIVEGRITFEEAARTYSEDNSSSVGGDLGFFDRDRMVEPFTEAAFDLAVGDVSEPVKTQFGYHVIECTDERLDENGQRTEMRARHILLKLAPGQDTLDALREKAESLHTTAETQGLDAAAAEGEIEIVETPAFQEGFLIPGVANSLPGSRFAFANDAGALSPMLETDEAFYFFEVAERLPAGHRPLEDVRSLVDSSVLRERRAEIASARLSEALSGATTESDFAALAESAGLEHAVTDTFTMRQNIAEIGSATAFARVALETEVGQMRDEVETRRGVYAFKLLYKSEFDEEAYTAQRSSLAQNVLFSRQRMILQNWLDEAREKAEIDDRRADFL